MDEKTDVENNEIKNDKQPEDNSRIVHPFTPETSKGPINTKDNQIRLLTAWVNDNTKLITLLVAFLALLISAITCLYSFIYTSRGDIRENLLQTIEISRATDQSLQSTIAFDQSKLQSAQATLEVSSL